MKLEEIGCPIGEIMGLSGHSSLSGLFYYLKDNLDDKKRYVEMLSSEEGEIIKKMWIDTGEEIGESERSEYKKLLDLK